MNMLSMLGRGLPPEVLKILAAVAAVAGAGADILEELRELREPCERSGERHHVPPDLLAALSLVLADGTADPARIDAAARALRVAVEAGGSIPAAVRAVAPGREQEVFARWLLLSAAGVEAEGARNVLAALGGEQ